MPQKRARRARVFERQPEPLAQEPHPDERPPTTRFLSVVIHVSSTCRLCSWWPLSLTKRIDSQLWSNAERLCAIDQLIELCEPTQVRHMMAVIEPQFQRDFISLLPKELALYVLAFLSPRDLTRAAQTCRCWRILAEDNLLWREKCREAGIDDVKDTLNKRRLRGSSHHSNTLLSSPSGSNQSPPPVITPSPWKVVLCITLPSYGVGSVIV